MIAISDSRVAALSFFGRMADAITAETVPAAEYRVSIPGRETPALPKQDGFFVFLDLRPSAADYHFQFESSAYQARTFQKALPTTTPVELAFGGEDEVQVAVKTFNAITSKITFDKIPFLPRIPQDAPVTGPGGFSTTLKIEMAGIDLTSATLTSVAGLSNGDLLRIQRSHSLAARPGPYYRFPAGITLLALKLAEDTPEAPPLAGAKAVLKKVNTQPVAGTLVGGLEIKHATLPGPGPLLILGPAGNLETLSDARGQAVFFFPGHWPLTDLEIDFSHAGHLPKTSVIAVTAAQRTLATVKLTPA